MATRGSIDLEGLHDEYSEFLCSMCRKKKRNTEAERFCNGCQDYYCKKCVRFHDEVPALSNHNIINKSQFKLESSLKFPVVPTERCREHNNRPVDMFCTSHDSVGCTNCMVTYHSACDKVYIPDHVKNNSNPGTSIDIQKKLESLAKCLHDLGEEYGKEKKQHTSRRKNLVKKIRTLRTQINQRIDKLENNTLKELDDKLKTLNNKMEKKIKELKEIIQRLGQAKDSIDSAGGNLAQQFVSIKIASEVADNAEAVVDKTRDKPSPSDIDFTADQTLLLLLNQIQNLGTICQTHTSQIQSSVINTMQRQSKTNSSDILHSNTELSKYQSFDQSQQKSREKSNISQQTSMKQLNQVPASRNNSSLLNIKGYKKYSIKMKSDKATCNITSACVLEDDVFILVDFNNQKLKCLGRNTFTVTGFCYLPGYPYQVCAVRQQEVVVACGEAYMIQFVSVEGSTLQQTRSISTNFSCYGVAYADGKLYVADLISVYVYTLSGIRLNQFKQDRSGQALFSIIDSLAISRENSRIYVADQDKGLIILNITGQHVGQSNPPELDMAYGVCLHKTGNVLVCGYRSNNVLQFNADGHLIGEVLKTDKYCQAICFNKNYSQLIIGYGNNNEIEIYHIL